MQCSEVQCSAGHHWRTSLYLFPSPSLSKVLGNIIYEPEHKPLAWSRQTSSLSTSLNKFPSLAQRHIFVFYSYSKFTLFTGIFKDKNNVEGFLYSKILNFCNNSGNKMLEIMKFWAWLWAIGLNLIMDESELWAQSLKVEAWAFQAFQQLVHLCMAVQCSVVQCKSVHCSAL